LTDLAMLARSIHNLRALSSTDRASTLAADPRRFAHPLLIEALLDEARASLAQSPRESLAWAQLADAELRRRDPLDHAQIARVTAYRGNALRVAGDLPGARQVLLAAQALLLESDASVYPAREAAEVHSFLGSLETDLRHFDAALDHLRTAACLFHDASLDTELARVEMKISNVHTYRGDLPNALQADYAALVHLDQAAEPRLYVGARFNLAYDLLELGNDREALDCLLYDEDMYAAHADEPTQLRKTWLLGRIAGKLGNYDKCEELLTAARDGFVTRSVGFDAALAGLDLALLFLQQHRIDEVHREAELALRVFAACEVHPEALAALRLLALASAARCDADSFRDTIAFLRKAQREPHRRSLCPS
jgi:tetratricopeptide (TPR) repeat protein